MRRVPARATYVIKSVTVTSLCLTGGGCDVAVRVVFKEARGATGDNLKVQQTFIDSSSTSTHTVPVTDASRYRGSLLVTTDFYGLTLWSGTWKWGAFLEDVPRTR